MQLDRLDDHRDDQGAFDFASNASSGLTADPILTMDLAVTAVPTGVSAARATP
jgi:hypothetical protein